MDFLGEAEMMKQFDHRNIVKLLGVCTMGDPMYVIMEFVLHGKNLPISSSVNIVNIVILWLH